MLYNVFLCLLAASASCVVGQGSVACTAGRPEVLTTEGNFSSPNYPENYPANSLCEWHIVAPEGKLVRIEVTSLELGVCCECDYLELIDGDTAAGVQYGHWYENDVPPAFTSRTNNVYARFRSDPTANYAGFNLVYTFV